MKAHDDALLRLFHVTKRYGVKNALLDISLDIFKNEFLFLTGPSGAGKSTLLKLLYLGESLSEGQILIDKMNLSRISRNRAPELRRKLGIIFQDYKLIPTKTVFENVSLVLEARGMGRKFIRKKVDSVLRTVGMEARKMSFPPSLSGGEQQKVAVARAVVGDPKIILADEPTGSLDADSAETIMDLLINIHARGATVLVATHDTELVRSIKARVIQLKEGRVVP
ncbi:MAG: cell division ATP-binding protein FtsE [Deltaproteobacteria bacterium]|nr:cell division ATP-binding protein FtsE [Deltaproteobacteria bacterium]